MEEKNGAKISLRAAICICIVLILIFAAIAVYYFGFVVNKTELEPATYIIKFDANLLGEEYNEPDYLMEEESYTIKFSRNNEVQFDLGWGIYMKGTYTILNKGTISCKLTSFSSEMPPEQNININISLKMNSKSEIEIIDIPEKYIIKVTELGTSGWKLTDETKTMEFWPFVKGIKFVLSTY